MHTTDNYQLISAHINLANSIAARRKRTIPTCVTLEELQSAAYMGLMDASKRFAPRSGDTDQDFASFVRPRIEGAITDYLRELRWGSRRLPVKTKELQDAGRETEGYDDLFEVVSKPMKGRVKEILQWHFVEGQTQAEIASRLGVTRARINQTIKGFVNDARSRWTQTCLCG